MKKTKRYLFLLVALLMALVVRAYKIEAVNATFGSIPVITYGSGATPVNVNTTDIPSGQIVTMTVTPNNGYYLSSLVYEEVTDLGWALAPQRRVPNILAKQEITIPTTSTYASAHFGGTYTFEMPENNVIITATFQPCTSITSAYVYWDDWNGTDPLPQSKVYDRYQHTMVVKVGDNILGNERHYSSTETVRTDVGSITPTITGWGEYTGTISTTTLSITQKTLNIAADADQSKIFGDSDPTFTYTQTGLCYGDQITGELSRAVGENVGSYAINMGDLTAGSNYSISFIPQNFAINAKDLSAVALNITLDHDYFNDNGAVQKAQITGITYGNTTLNSGSDYNSTFTYGTGVYGKTDNTAPDIYPISVEFIGNYTGTKTVEYQIRPEITLNNTSGNRWRTFYEKTYNMEVVEDKFEACTVSDITVNAVTLGTRDVIKAGTPMLLYRITGTASGIYPALIKPTDSRVTGSWSGVSDDFKCKVDEDGDPEAWTLDGTTSIMILVNDKFVRSKSGTLAAGKCYLDVSSSSPSSAPSLFIGVNTTGIEEIETQDTRKDYPFYDLSGRRVMNPSKGLYIVNGKKIIIK